MVEHFAKKQKEIKTVAKEEDIKSNSKMNEGKNEIAVRHIDGIAGGLNNKYNISERIINYSRFNGKSDIFV